jgi:hypothetical protein
VANDAISKVSMTWRRDRGSGWGSAVAVWNLQHREAGLAICLHALLILPVGCAMILARGNVVSKQEITARNLQHCCPLAGIGDRR